MKQQIIIFEGHDKSGKSTIAQALSGQLGIPIFKMNLPKHFWDFTIHQRYATEAITQVLEQTGVSVILDRSFLSDFVYSELFNRQYSLKEHLNTDQRFANMHALIVYCYKDDSFFQHDEEDKAFISISDYARIKELYDIMLETTSCKYIKLNTSNENLEEQLSTIINNI